MYQGLLSSVPLFSAGQRVLCNKSAHICLGRWMQANGRTIQQMRNVLYLHAWVHTDLPGVAKGDIGFRGGNSGSRRHNRVAHASPVAQALAELNFCTSNDSRGKQGIYNQGIPLARQRRDVSVANRGSPLFPSARVNVEGPEAMLCRTSFLGLHAPTTQTFARGRGVSACERSCLCSSW